jgi:NAD(P)-dependent dehydrogenase (short-subunit alcohol dehydrogenase family)
MTWTLVTGGAKRLGAEICHTLASQGHHLAIHYRRSESQAEALAEKCRQLGVKAKAIQGDFSTTESTQVFAKKYLQEFPDTKNLVNNVGNYFIGSALQTPIEQWMELFQNNLNTPLILIQALGDSLKKSEGSIVNIGVAGINNIRADVYSTAYSCAKTCLWMLTKSLAAEFAAYRVKVNMISPGYLDIAVDLPQEINKLPMKRPAESKEIAEAIAFLLGGKAQYITGQNIEIAGGTRL